MVSPEQSIFIRALQRKPVERTPVWIMRQAGRYLPEYRATRQRAGSFMQLCKNPELACEVTLQPLTRFNLDAAIIFSDILTIPDAFGMGLEFIEGEGPCFAKTLDKHTITDLIQIPQAEIVGRLQYVMDAITLVRKELPHNLPLIGFAGSPFTMACYMLEGKSSRTFTQITDYIYTNPAILHQLLQTLAQTVVAYLANQVANGANALMIFDTWGGMLSPINYKNFSLHYMDFIVREVKLLHPEIPIILFTKGSTGLLESMAKTSCDALGVDWTCDLADARQRVGSTHALQGNLDPAILRTTPDCIREETGKVLAAYGNGSGLIFNLGHGVTPDINPDNVAVMVNAVHEFSPEYHKELTS